jgi:GNAT superfamily N-acetyltransferase
MQLSVISYPERPNLWVDTGSVSEEVWPEYNLHGDVLNHYWSGLLDVFPEYQFALVDDATDEVVAEGHTAPCPWDGTIDGLGEGIDETIAWAFASRAAGNPPRALCALAAEIRPGFRGQGLATRILQAMTNVAREHELPHLIAPVRPSVKERYPITPIEQYVAWTRDDGEPFDPWIRTHTRIGGVITKPIPRSMRITGTVAEWEAWTAMRFPGDGRYTFPRGLAPVEIDHDRDLGSYWEPNVWIVHTVD